MPPAEVRNTGGVVVGARGKRSDEFGFGNVESEVPVGFPVHLQHS